ncbi:MAG: tyrosine-protein phosphatase [Pseudomonadota bacterium]
MIRKTLLASVFLATACAPETGTDTPETAGSPESVVTIATVSDVEIVHGGSPNEFGLTWTVDEPGAGVSIFVSTSPNDPMPTLIAQDVVGGAYAWTADGEPARRYFTISASGNAGDGVTAAVRLLPLEGGRNFRDLGGYATADGKTVKWGHAFRSGVMHELTDADYDYLSGIGVKVICDFRETDERLREPTDWRGGAAEYLTFADPAEQDPADNPMFAALMSPEATADDVAEGMAAGYVDIAKGEVEGYTKMFDRLAAGDIPLAFNCSAGKDRAGTAAALLLTALGVPRETVVYDYSLSDDYVDYMAEFLNDEARAEAAADPENPYAFLFQLPPEKVAPLLASHPMYIESTFDALDEEYGSVMTFIQAELDVSDSELAAIRSSLLE